MRNIPTNFLKITKISSSFDKILKPFQTISPKLLYSDWYQADSIYPRWQNFWALIAIVFSIYKQVFEFFFSLSLRRLKDGVKKLSKGTQEVLSTQQRRHEIAHPCLQTYTQDVFFRCFIFTMILRLRMNRSFIFYGCFDTGHWSGITLPLTNEIPSHFWFCPSKTFSTLISFSFGFCI